MATPLFRPNIEQTLARFLETHRAQAAKTMLEQYSEVLEQFTRYLDQEGSEQLPEHLSARWTEANANADRFCQAFNSSQILPNVPGFLQDLEYQQSVLPKGMLANARRIFHELGRWLVASSLGTETDYLEAIQALPCPAEELDDADAPSSMLFDLSRDDPPYGKGFDQMRGYVEIVQVRRQQLVVCPIRGPAGNATIHVPQDAAAIARAGWWIDAHLARTGNGWRFIEVVTILP